MRFGFLWFDYGFTDLRFVFRVCCLHCLGCLLYLVYCGRWFGRVDCCVYLILLVLLNGCDLRLDVAGL